METIGQSVRASMDFHGPLNALSTSPNNKLIAVGGRDVLKIVALEAAGFTEKRNLRVGKPSLNFSTNDIRWHPQSDSLLATAATNGSVVIWNLEREGFKHVQERVLNGHRRAVNRICWHTTDMNVLISGSQDGTIKLWDKRGKVANTYQPKSESVRDVRVSPFQANKFAAVFENGTVQVWDIRKNLQPEIKFTAHKGLVLAIDWHPTKANLLASGGRDRYVKIWDWNDPKQPKQTIQTIASVGRVAWRPNCVDHIATSASLMDNSIHVWDVQRPFIPIASMKGHTDIASGISWLDTPVSSTFANNDNVSDWEGLDFWQHMLACSKDGTLKLHSLADSFKPHQSLPTTALALNSKGQMAFSHDYVDRSCASLKIHRHFNISSALFTVTDVSSGAGPSTGLKRFHLSSSGSENMDETYLDQLNSRLPTRTIGGAQPPPLAPRVLGRSSTTIGNGSGLGGNIATSSHSKSVGNMTSVGSAVGSGIVRHAPGTLSPAGGPINAALERNISAGEGLDARRGNTPSSPMPTPFTRSTTPRALVALVSMQNISKASQLEKIFMGDEQAYVEAEQQVEVLKAQFVHGLHLKESFGFDEDAFRFLANHYSLFRNERDDIPELTFAQMCAHNALAAFVTGNSHLCQMWRILEVLYGSDANGGGDVTKLDNTKPHDQHTIPEHAVHHPATNGHDDLLSLDSDHRNTHHHPHHHVDDNHLHPSRQLQRKDSKTSEDFSMPATDNPNQTTMLLQQLDHVNPQALQGFDPYPYDAKGLVNGDTNLLNGATGSTVTREKKSSSMIVHGNAVHGELSHLRDAVLKELLEYYVNIGDLQTCTAIAIVVGKVSNVEKVMGEAWLQQIYMHYVDLLHQLRIYSAANELISNCSDQSIRQMNMKSTSVYFNCAKCSKPIESYSGTSNPNINDVAPTTLCSNCSNVVTRCSICQLPVRGLYVWCPVCSHGGHLEHLSEWFAMETMCPTGCSHRCSLKVVSSMHTDDDS